MNWTASHNFAVLINMEATILVLVHNEFVSPVEAMFLYYFSGWYNYHFISATWLDIIYTMNPVNDTLGLNILTFEY